MAVIADLPLEDEPSAHDSPVKDSPALGQSASSPSQPKSDLLIQKAEDAKSKR